MERYLLKVKIAKSWKEKMFGNMFRSEILPLSFRTRFGIHTFFVRKEMDILILDSEYKVVKIKEGLLPWKIFLWDIRYDLVIELPAGEIKRKKLKFGCIVKI